MIGIGRWRRGACASIVALLAVGGCDAPPDNTAPADLPKEAEAVVEALIQAVGPCDAAGQIAQSTMAKSNDPVEAYEVLKRAAEYCRNSASEVSNLKPPPSAEGETKKAFEASLTTCSVAQIYRAEGFEKVAAVLNGDSRPSAVVESRDAMDEAQNTLLRCVAGMQGALQQAGGALPEAWRPDEPIAEK